MLACAAHTGSKPQELAQTWIEPQEAVDPDPKRAARYNEQFEAYKHLYPTIQDFHDRTASASGRLSP